MNKTFQKITAFTLLVAFNTFNTLPVLAFGKANKTDSSKTNSARKTVSAGVSDYRLAAVNIDWWDKFNDPYLKEYIYKTVEYNHELRIATLKTQEYYQNIKATRAGQLPQVSISGNYARLRTPGFDLNGLTLDPNSSNIYAVPLVASYEADVFLKNKNKTQSAKKQYEASKYEEKAIYISLATSTATTYFNVIKLDKLIALQEDVVKVRKDIFELTKDRYKAGLASTFDTTATDKQHTIAMIELNDLKKQRALLLHQLAVLMGENPSCADNIKRTSIDEIEYKNGLPASISSEVVLNRPDLMQAEAQLQKAKIDVKVARKEFLPTVPIFGVVGFNSIQLSHLFDWDSFLALIAVGLTQNLFTGGRKMANLKTQKIRYEEMFENYKKVDLQAIQEINDSLCQIKYDTQKDKDNARKYSLEKNNFNLIEERYKAGITSRFDKIQFEENLLALQKDNVVSKTQRLVDYLSLYKSTGGAL